MRKILWSLLVLMVILLLSLHAQAQDKNWGIGLRLGDPTGLTAKKYLGASNAVELALGANYRGKGLEFLAHYLFHFPVNAQGLDWYYGLGVQIENRDRPEKNRRDDTEFGADGVIGLEYTFPRAPLSIFVDAILFIELIDDPFDLDLDAALGIRYNF